MNKEEIALLDEEQAMLDEEQSILDEEQALSELNQDAGVTAPPEAQTESVIPQDSGVSPADIEQLRNVNEREMAQLEGRERQFESVTDIIPQVTSMALNPFRNVLGMEKRQAGTFIDPITQWQADETQRRLSLSERGISSGDTPLGSRFIESLAMDDKNRIKAIQKNLNDQFDGEEVKVWIDQPTNDLVYMNPDDQKVYTANPLGFEFGDVLAYTGDAITATFEALGTVFGVGQAASKRALKKSKDDELTDKEYSKSRTRNEIGYGAAGAVVGNAVKISLGKAFDINDEVSKTEIIADSLKEGALSLGVGAGFEALRGLITKVRSVRGEQVIPAHLLDNFKDKLDKIPDNKMGTEVGNNQVVDVINDTLRDAQMDSVLRPNVGQLLNDSETLDMIEALKKAGTQESYALEAREATDTAAQLDYFTIISQQVSDQAPVGKYQISQDVKGVVQGDLDSQLAKAQAPTLAAQQQSQSIIKDLPSSSAYESSKLVKGALYEEEAALKEVFEKEYRAIESAADGLDIKSPMFNMKLNLAKLDSTETGVKSKNISDEFIADDLDLATEWSLPKLNNSIKRFNELKREANNGKSSASYGKVKKTIQILKNAQQEMLKDHPDVLLKMNALNEAYDVGQQIFNDSIVNKIIRDKDALATSDIFQAVIKNSDTAENTAAAILNRPDAMLAMQKGINDFYINEVSQDGIINLEKHNNFVRKYIKSKRISRFFTEKQLKNIETAGGIARVYKVEKAKTDSLVKEINKTFESKVSSLDGKGLFNKVWGEEKQESIIGLKRILSKHPKYWKNVQSEMLNTIKTDIFSGGTFSYKKLDTLIEKNGRTIELGLGEGYLNNLRTLRDSLDITGRKGKAFNLDKESGAATLVLLGMGRLHKRAKMVTSADKLRSTYARKLLAEMVLDPEKLRELSALRRTRTGSNTFKLIMTRLGARILTDTGERYNENKDFRTTLSEIGFKAGSMYKQQVAINKLREKELEKNKEKEKEDRLMKLRSRQKSLSQYN